MKANVAARIALGVVTVLAVCTVAWTAAYYLTGWFYAQVGLHPSPLARQLITALLGLWLIAIPAGVFGAVHRPREIAMWRSILAAIDRIAQGDFRVRVRVETPMTREQHPYSQLVHSINGMAEGLEGMERLRQEFIANVSHEIQSPLTSIGGFARALRDDGLSEEERRRYLDIIATESERLSQLSDNLLKLTALDAPALQLAEYRLDRQLQRVVLAAEPQWSGKRIEVAADLHPVAVVADEGLMEHVWANLVHNAVKFTPEGGQVSVRLRGEGEGVTVEVADTGIGIAPEDQLRIFERFFKADRARERATGGSGLGLALVKRIVELHGGQVAVRSEPGHGSAFAVTLSCRPVLTSSRNTSGRA